MNALTLSSYKSMKILEFCNMENIFLFIYILYCISRTKTFLSSLNKNKKYLLQIVEPEPRFYRPEPRFYRPESRFFEEKKTFVTFDINGNCTESSLFNLIEK